MAIGAHDDEIGAESGSLRQQKVAHLFAAGGQASYFHLCAVTRQVARLDALELYAVRLDHVEDALAAGEHLRLGDRGLRLDEYAGQARVVLLREYAGELQDASDLGAPIDEDDDFTELSRALVVAPGVRPRRRRPRRLLVRASEADLPDARIETFGELPEGC